MEKKLINLTNHPSKEWDESQLKDSLKYGEIEDMAFPQISPNWDISKVMEEVDKYDRLINRIAQKNDVTVHVMGEQTFCYGIISKLTRSGIKCIASCTERGTFNFIRFREYPNNQQ